MYKTFENLSTEKKNRILNASYEIFGKYGYAKASINDIAKASGISKASLFHYFTSKEKLYFYLYDFAALQIASHMREGTEDFFESIRLSVNLKLELFQKYPSMFRFLKSIVLEDEALFAQLQSRNQTMIAEKQALLFKNIDWSRLNTTNIQDILNLLTWVTEGCIRANIHLTSEQLAGEIGRYLEYLKKAFYKETFL